MADAILNSSFFVEAKTTVEDHSFGDLNDVVATVLTDCTGILRTQVSVSTGSSQAINLTGEFKFGMVVADQEITLLWIGTTQADSSAVVVPANEPFFFSTGTTSTYSATSSTRTSSADDDITAVYARNDSGSAAVVRFYALTVD